MLLLVSVNCVANVFIIALEFLISKTSTIFKTLGENGKTLNLIFLGDVE